VISIHKQSMYYPPDTGVRRIAGVTMRPMTDLKTETVPTRVPTNECRKAESKYASAKGKLRSTVAIKDASKRPRKARQDGRTRTREHALAHKAHAHVNTHTKARIGTCVRVHAHTHKRSYRCT
jgi:hypothetical protein